MKNSDNAIEVSNVKKFYKVYYDRGITFKERFLSRGRSKYEKREVLKGITFEVKKGEAVGLIGKNGCGKSTTLKLLTRIIYPNEGTIELTGRVSSLLELGAGFHPDMSGRENIYMNAAVFGLSKKEIDKRVDNIIRFSELKDYIDNPVRTYSSGMYMRLAFSVAINVDADVLLIDEILAVGDISFQKKCFEKLKDIKRNGTTIVIVSHSLDQIEKICNKSIWIEDGIIREAGSPKEVHEHYLHDMEQKRLENFQAEVYADMEFSDKADDTAVEKEIIDRLSEQDPTKEEHMPVIAQQMACLKKNFLRPDNNEIEHTGNQRVVFTEMYVTDGTGTEKLYFETGSDVNIFLTYQTNETGLRGTLCLLIYRDDGMYCYGSNTFIEHLEIKTLKKKGYLKVTLKAFPLLPAKYYFSIGIHDEQAESYDSVEHAAWFQIYSTKGEQGIVRINSEWETE